jgi:hypothetical protein
MNPLVVFNLTLRFFIAVGNLTDSELNDDYCMYITSLILFLIWS